MQVCIGVLGTFLGNFAGTSGCFGLFFRFFIVGFYIFYDSLSSHHSFT